VIVASTLASALVIQLQELIQCLRFCLEAASLYEVLSCHVSFLLLVELPNPFVDQLDLVDSK